MQSILELVEKELLVLEPIPSFAAISQKPHISQESISLNPKQRMPEKKPSPYEFEKFVTSAFTNKRQYKTLKPNHAKEVSKFPAISRTVAHSNSIVKNAYKAGGMNSSEGFKRNSRKDFVLDSPAPAFAKHNKKAELLASQARLAQSDAKLRSLLLQIKDSEARTKKTKLKPRARRAEETLESKPHHVDVVQVNRSDIVHVPEHYPVEQNPNRTSGHLDIEAKFSTSPVPSLSPVEETPANKSPGRNFFYSDSRLNAIEEMIKRVDQQLTDVLENIRETNSNKNDRYVTNMSSESENKIDISESINDEGVIHTVQESDSENFMVEINVNDAGSKEMWFESTAHRDAIPIVIDHNFPEHFSDSAFSNHSDKPIFDERKTLKIPNDVRARLIRSNSRLKEKRKFEKEHIAVIVRIIDEIYDDVLTSVVHELDVACLDIVTDLVHKELKILE